MRRGECPCTVRGMRRKEAERCYTRRRPRPAKSVSQSVVEIVPPRSDVYVQRSLGGPRLEKSKHRMASKAIRSAVVVAAQLVWQLSTSWSSSWRLFSKRPRTRQVVFNYLLDYWLGFSVRIVLCYCSERVCAQLIINQGIVWVVYRPLGEQHSRTRRVALLLRDEKYQEGNEGTRGWKEKRIEKKGGKE